MSLKSTKPGNVHLWALPRDEEVRPAHRLHRRPRQAVPPETLALLRALQFPPRPHAVLLTLARAAVSVLAALPHTDAASSLLLIRLGRRIYRATALPLEAQVAFSSTSIVSTDNAIILAPGWQITITKQS